MREPRDAPTPCITAEGVPPTQIETPRYQEAAAKLAWEQTISFFPEHLP